MNVVDECRLLKKGGIHIVSATPGRILDLIERHALSLQDLRQVFLDEAGEMLSMGFKEQIYNIFQYLPESAQVGLFSATLPLEILKVSQRFLRNPVRVLVKQDEKLRYIAVHRVVDLGGRVSPSISLPIEKSIVFETWNASILLKSLKLLSNVEDPLKI